MFLKLTLCWGGFVCLLAGILHPMAFSLSCQQTCTQPEMSHNPPLLKPRNGVIDRAWVYYLFWWVQLCKHFVLLELALEGSIFSYLVLLQMRTNSLPFSGAHTSVRALPQPHWLTPTVPDTHQQECCRLWFSCTPGALQGVISAGLDGWVSHDSSLIQPLRLSRTLTEATEHLACSRTNEFEHFL